MTSSMLSGEKRWASARRGGMTVLGKVAVPKPINLPSQRLENHGLDPNVEIVPKGTHSWGSRSSSSSSNAWGSASLSPNADGGTGSPSHLSGRPSSSGTGTRPSTAGSERTHDPVTNAWGSNSRPSSSSGALTSNQTSHPALRPRSAETRPGSSQLSRFAEPLSDNSVAWSGTGTSEKLGVTSSKVDGFSLTSGDFPTLGSEKDISAKNIDSQEYASQGRPGSSAGLASGKEGTRDSAGEVSVNVNTKIGAAGSWRKDNSTYGEDGPRSNAEKWHADSQSYPNSSIPPQHYDAWHGPPVNNHPTGVWYRGPPGGPPFGSPIAPGGFPMEPFPYYHPQLPRPALANPQPVPPPGAGRPRGPHPKNGDMYRPHMHDAYIRPGMPLRPGFYPGPVPYDGYYGPPMGYCNSNERDASFMGMAMGPNAYNRYPGQNVPDPGNSHGRTSGYGPSSKAMVTEQIEAVQPQDPRGPYKVLLKHHDSWEGKDEEQKCDDLIKTNPPYSLNEHSRKSSWENGRRADNKKDDDVDARRVLVGEGASSETVDNQVVPMKVKSPEHMGYVNPYSDGLGKKKFEHAATIPEVPTAPKDSSLIQKIEGLNAKARSSDGRQDSKSVSGREEQMNKLEVGNALASRATNEVGFDSLSHERTRSGGINNTAPQEDRFSSGDKILESAVVSGTTISRRSAHGMHGRTDHRGKGRVNTPETDGWRKKSDIVDLQNTASTVHNEISSVSVGQHHISADAGQNFGSQPSGKDNLESMPPVSDPSDSQRVKMRELAKRLKQREKEEEERLREQRAKALAKLEELNRRTQAGEVATEKLETAPTSNIQNKKDESLNLSQQTAASSKSGASSSSLGSKTNTIAQSRHKESTAADPPSAVTDKPRASSSARDSSLSMVAQNSGSSVNRVEKSTSVASTALLEPKTAHFESGVVHEQLKSFQQDGSNADAARAGSTSRVHDSSASKQKRTGYRQKHNALGKNSSEKSFSSSATDTSKIHTDFATVTSKVDNDIAADAATSSESVAEEFVSNCESNLSVNLSLTAESSAHTRRKNKSGKNKHKLEEASSATSSASKVSKDMTTLDTLVESAKPKPSEAMLDLNSGLSQIELKDANQSSELCYEEAHNRVNNQWKSHHHRRMMRNQQGNKSAEKNHNGDAVVWAPVRSQNKTEVSDEPNQNTIVESMVLSSKSDQQAQNNPRNKRAEMERYIPKPAAKELSQQAVVSLTNQITSDEIVERPGSVDTESSQTCGTTMGKAGLTVESRNGDGRQNKSGKVHGSWRQRGVAESTTNPSRSFQKSMEDHQHQKPDLSSMKEQPGHPDEWNFSDGWNMPENPDTAVTLPVLKDQGLVARGKRQPHKGHKANHNPDEKRTGGGDTEKVYFQPTAPKMHQKDSFVASKENHAVGEQSTSHWQPKSQSFSSTNQLGSRPNNSVNVGPEGVRANKKESTQGGGLLPQPDKDTIRHHSHHDQSPFESGNLEEGPAVGHQEPKRERKIGGHRGHPGSPIESSSHSNMDGGQDHRMSSGFRKSGNLNNRFGREHDSWGDWNGSGKDNKQQHNASAIRESQRHNSHYEYQPVGPQKNNKANNFEPPKEGSHNSGGRYRERGQTRRGGGNFYGRQSGGIQIDSGYE
eukprot:XP_015580054.1 protein MODIFIER OF SNC1 1 [Ricinus communis]